MSKRESARAVIFSCFKNGMSVKDARAYLTRTFGTKAPSRMTTYRWYSRFAAGMETFEDAQKSGRKVSKVTAENIEKVRQFVTQYPHSTYKQIEHETGLSAGTVNTILKRKLRMKKLCARWIPHSLSEEQKRARVEWCKKMLRQYNGGRSRHVGDIVTGDETWLYYYDPTSKRDSAEWVPEKGRNPVKVRAQKSAGKRMFSLFFRRSGFVAKIMLKERCTATAAWYIRGCLSKVFRNLKELRPNCGLKGVRLHHDNARVHTAHVVERFLQRRKIRLTGHPAYSPDLAPLDFYYNSKIKKQLRGIRFRDEAELCAAVKRAIRSIAPHEHRKCFSDWFERMRKCIERGGEYFEKLAG
jgi:[histone H3]-lysine36 N-dimethyltransferase SETMAR